MILLSRPAVDPSFITAAIVGVVKLLKRLKDQDYWGAAVVASAALVYGLTSFFNIDGLSLLEGIRQGLAAAGIFRLVQAFTGDKTIVG